MSSRWGCASYHAEAATVRAENAISQTISSQEHEEDSCGPKEAAENACYKIVHFLSLVFLRRHNPTRGGVGWITLLVDVVPHPLVIHHAMQGCAHRFVGGGRPVGERKLDCIVLPDMGVQ